MIAAIILALLYHGVASGNEIKYSNWVLHFEARYLFLHNDSDGIAWQYKG